MSTHPPVDGAPPRERLNVLLLALSQALFLIAAVTVMTLSGVVGQALTPSPVLATLPVAFMQVGTVVTTLPASLLMKRIGRRPGFLIGTIAGGVLGSAVSTLGVVTASFWIFCAGNLLLGVYQGFAMYYRFAAVDCASTAFRSKAISLVMAGGVVAAILGPWNADYGQLLWDSHPEAGPYLMLTALAVVATILIGLLRVPASGEPAGEAFAQRPMRQIAVQPAFPVALIAAAVGYAVMILGMTGAPIAMRDSGFGMDEAATVMQWHVLGMFAPSFITGSLIARYGLLNILLVGAALLFASSGIAVSGENYWHYWSALLLLGVGWNFLFIGGSNLLTWTHNTEERGKVQGINDLTVFSLVALGSLLAGALLHELGWAGLNLVMLFPLSVTLIAILYLRLLPQGRWTHTVPSGQGTSS